MIYSSSSIYGWNKYGDSFYYLKRHLVYVGLGLVLMAAAMSLDQQTIKKFAKPFFAAALIALILSFIPGISREAAGARRWIRVGPFGFQPSELIKLALIIYLADFLSRRRNDINDLFNGLLPPAIAVGIPVLLILLQPDLGTAVSLVCIATIMLFVAGLRYRYFLFAGAVSLPVLYVLVFSVPYRRSRILAFLDPWADPTGRGFQIIQSFIALGSGGLLGQGLGQGKQKLFYLPAAHTDFIFSVIGEEMGILGAIAIIVLFIILIWQMVRIVSSSKDAFLQFLAVGIVSAVALESVINIGVSIGLFPTKGLPLPFVSYGGSALVFDLVAMGLLLNISRAKNVAL